MSQGFRTERAKLLRLACVSLFSGVISLASAASFAAVPFSKDRLSQGPPVFGASSVAQSAPVRDSIEDIWKKSQSLRPEPSTDTTPISAKVGDVRYSIPRNYISSLHFNFPILKVTYPGFEPFTEGTRGCFDRKPQTNLGCTTLELKLRLSFPNKPRFENSITFHDPDRKLSPRGISDGYEVYDVGPENARLEIYRSEGEDIFSTCGIFDNNGVRDAVCDDAVSLADGNAVRFVFSLNQIEEIRKIEAGIRKLMAGFQTGGAK